jgi:hypothetical protein
MLLLVSLTCVHFKALVLLLSTTAPPLPPPLIVHQVTCTDAGRISVGAVGPGASDQNAWFGSVAALLDGPLYESQVAKNAKHEAMTKVHVYSK